MSESETRIANTDPMINTPDTFELPDASAVESKLQAISDFQALVHRTFIEGHDYGVIPGTPKPTLLKAGAQKLIKLLNLADTYDIIEAVKDWDKPFFAYEVKCILRTIEGGLIVSEGLGECNSYETKYRWRQGERECPECHYEGAIIKGKREFGGGWLCFQKKNGCGAKWPDGAKVIESQKIERVPNPDVADQVNTFLKMASKRALVDAALSAGRLSDLFTQDMEDMKRPDVSVEQDKPQQRTAAERPAKAPETAAQPPQQAEGAETQGSADTLPNQVTPPENMTSNQFITLYKRVGWNIKEVCKMLGAKHNVPMWLEDAGRRDDYNYAWARLMEVWGKEQTETLVFP